MRLEHKSSALKLQQLFFFYHLNNNGKSVKLLMVNFRKPIGDHDAAVPTEAERCREQNDLAYGQVQIY